MDNFFATISKIAASHWWVNSLYILAFLAGVLWLSLVFWTLKDARKRIDDVLIVAVAVATSLVLPFVGTVVYAILRPAEYLADARERELEMRAIEQELHALRACPSCGEVIRPDYLMCPSCRRPLRTSCPTCGRVLEPAWKICPYCAHDLKMRRVPLPVDQPTAMGEPARVEPASLLEN